MSRPLLSLYCFGAGQDTDGCHVWGLRQYQSDQYVTIFIDIYRFINIHKMLICHGLYFHFITLALAGAQTAVMCGDWDNIKLINMLQYL
jgi:hypothetical protein